jgi:hypothetical protein
MRSSSTILLVDAARGAGSTYYWEICPHRRGAGV